MELWTAFVLGLVGSLHCAGMCGPLALAIPVAPGGPGRFFLGRLLYNAGRLATYCALGLAFGLVGRTLLLAGVQRWLSIALGLLLLTGAFASRRLALAAPVTRLVARLKQAMSRWLHARTLGALPVLGALTGLLPCGLVYVACAGAAATGSLAGGLGYMAAFGAGTVPMMLAIGLSGRLVPLDWRHALVRVVPLVVALLGGLLILRGLSLGIPYLSPDLTAPSGAACCH
jgi:sulfite exporter TauE/SafE